MFMNMNICYMSKNTFFSNMKFHGSMFFPTVFLFRRFRALVDAGSSIEHLAVASNDIGDEGETGELGNEGDFWMI